MASIKNNLLIKSIGKYPLYKPIRQKQLRDLYDKKKYLFVRVKSIFQGLQNNDHNFRLFL